MTKFIWTWLKVRKKPILLIVLLALLSGTASVFVQKKEALNEQLARAERVEVWYENTKMELVPGEVSEWNNYIGDMLSDLGLLRTFWSDPAANADEIVDYENAYYAKAIRDPDYCMRVLHESAENVERKLDLAKAYEERGWKQPLNPIEPRADYMVYSTSHSFSLWVLLVLGAACAIGTWIWAAMSESREYMLLFGLPYSKRQLFGALIILGIGISMLFMFLQYGSAWLAGMMISGNAPLLVIENGKIAVCSQVALHNMVYPVLMCLCFSCLSALVGVWIRSVSDTLMVLVIVLMSAYFSFSTIVWFSQMPIWIWSVSVLFAIMATGLAWRKFAYEA